MLFLFSSYDCFINSLLLLNVCFFFCILVLVLFRNKDNHNKVQAQCLGIVRYVCLLVLHFRKCSSTFGLYKHPVRIFQKFFLIFFFWFHSIPRLCTQESARKSNKILTIQTTAMTIMNDW